MAEPVVNFGILADTSAQLDCLEKIVLAAGQAVGLRLQALSKNVAALNEANVDAWIVQVSLHNDDCETRFLEALDIQAKPVIYDDMESFASLNSQESAKRLTRKINECVQAASDAPLARAKAKEVWVLAASAGGPEAVAEFLRAMSSDYGDVAFLYAQHINVGYEGSLQTMVLRNSRLEVFDSDKAHLLRSGCLYIVSPKHQIELHETGWMTPVEQEWPGDYSPSLDQVIAKVARRYGKKSGAIIFSGMGDDGSASCVFMKHSGGQVWAQSPSSCALDSMPKQAIGKKVIGVIAPPSQLAVKFVERHRLAMKQ